MSAAKKDRLLYNAFAVLSHPERSGWDKFFFFLKFMLLIGKIRKD